MIALAARTAPAARLAIAELPNLEFADESFAATVANFVINHVGDPRAAVAELARVTGAGGRVAISIWPVPHPPLQQLWQE